MLTTTSTKKILNVPGVPAAPISAHKWTDSERAVDSSEVMNRNMKYGHKLGCSGSNGKAASTSETRMK
eukprot:4328976-Prymnesium_polylepis.1